MGQTKRVLLVESYKDDSELFRVAYGAANVSNPLDVVPTREDAMDYLKNEDAANSLALIILASPLHLINDFPLLRWIRNQPRFSNVRVFVLSGQRIDHEESKAHDLGSDCYSEKPFSFQS